MSKHKQQAIQPEDFARWLTFGGFWGFVFYLLSFAGLLLGHRHQPVRVNTRTSLVGMIIHTGFFVGMVSLFSALQSLLTGKSSSQTGRERVSGGTLERSILKLAVGGGLGSIIPFALSVGSLKAAETITGEAAFQNSDDINWIQAAGTTALLSSITALSVARITAWVAQDSREGAMQSATSLTSSET